MLRIFSTLLRGLRSVKPSQCCPQDSTDELNSKYKEEVSRVHATQLRFYTTQGQYLSALRENAVLSLGKTHNLSFDHKGKCLTQIREASDYTQTRATPELENLKPPWLWRSLLDHCPEETTDEGSRNDKEGSQHWKRTCHKEEFLLKHSILQGLGWGSAVALTWSMYRDGMDNKFYPFWHSRYHEPSSHTTKAKKPCLIYQHEGSHKTQSENCSCPHGINCRSEHFQNFDGANTWYWHGRPTGTNNVQAKDNDFQKTYNINSNCNCNNLWNINSRLPSLDKRVKYKKEAKQGNVDPFFTDISSDSDTSDTENGITDFYKLDIRETISDESEAIVKKATLFHKDSLENYKVDSGCGSDCSNGTASQETFEKHNDSKDEEAKQQIPKAASSADLSIRKTVGTQTSAPTAAQCKEKVLVEDCPEDDHNNTGATNSHQHSHPNSDGISQFSDSLLEILAEGKEEIQSVQARFQKVLSSDVGVTLAERNPEQAVVFFRAGALLGDPSSIFNLALCYHTGRGVRQDFAMARQLYEASSLAGHGWGTYNLAVMVSRGEGGAVDTERAYKLLIMARHRGVKEAYFALSQCYQLSCEREVKLRSTQSEPNLAAKHPFNLSSSHSTTDLLFMDESDIEFSSDSSRDVVYVDDKSHFHL